MAVQRREEYGVLVGWTSSRNDNRVTLRLQSVDKSPPHRPEDVLSVVLVMDENQAVQLGNDLFKITGQTKPERKKRGLLARLFG
ncbi:hypothetical protein [Aurantiacibacter rhizosphaerae]|uniref:Uncharacterized protein n=1 Tax=Aurantiacibacter rhizosphaerae TaxID=2691582 RepID=A0A844XHN3_9SPHN|nr:hypothetical protein [Aurantiacibacter rhizosphaerae]MWV29074.1 hypothetical protein [Aurantiacibacter rhizosphaerae]